MIKRIYLDNAATTPVLPEVLDAMLPYFCEEFGNPGGSYSLGETAKTAVRNARNLIAKTIGAEPSEIYFTSGGSEGDNMAIRWVPYMGSANVITTAVEHKAVLNTCDRIDGGGITVTYLQPDERGYISPQQVESVISDGTILVSVMMVNNEIGTVMPIKEIAEVCHKHNVILHTDAVQAYGHMPIDVNNIGVDIMSVSGHKFHAPKGTGFVYIRKGIRIQPLIFGGGQESGMRSGTENVPGIVGMAKAAEIAHDKMDAKYEYVLGLRDHMIERIISEIPGAVLNGSLLMRCPNNVNVCIDGVSGEALLVLLDMRGVSASTGSACNSADGRPSHVLKAIGLTDDQARSSLRFTLDDSLGIDDIDYAVDVLKDCVGQLRILEG